MTGRLNSILFSTCLVSSILLSGCATTSSQTFLMSFLPPAPRQSAATMELAELPPLPPNPYLAKSIQFFQPSVTPKLSATDSLLKRAEERFQAGRRRYLSGDTANARSEFDRALDILLGAPGDLPDRARVEARIEQYVATIHRYDVNGMGSGDLSGKVAYDKAPLEDILETTFPADPTLKPKVSEQLGATVSQLPLQLNDSVLSYINYFSSSRGRPTLLAGLRRAGRYKPLITRILAEEGVPQELIYLAQAESGFLPRAVSHKAAVGMWQFIRSRGREYGLTQTAHTDDRLDPEKATRSAARHLRDLYNKFGDWNLAIAGYNCGDGCVERAVARTGYADFWTLRARRAIPLETTNYVPIILAMAIMHKNAKDYDLENIEIDPPLQYDTMELEAATHLALLADAADRPVSELRELNPALLTSVAPKGHKLNVPAGTKTMILAGLDSIPIDRRASWRIHRVGQGETIASIARRYNVPVSGIEAANDEMDADPGDVLVIPTASQLERLQPGSKRSSSASAKRSTRKPAQRRMANAFR